MAPPDGCGNDNALGQPLGNHGRMMMTELIMEGLELLVIGMGTVFVFLAVLVMSVSLMSKVALKFEPEAPAQDLHKPPVQTPAPAPQATAAQQVAAITAAAHHHKAAHGA